MILGGKVINPGELRTPISLGTRAMTVQTGGFRTPAYTAFATVWSRWENAHGGEVWQAAALNAVQPATVLIRYRGDVDETQGVRLGSDWYEIVSMDNIEQRSEYIELKVKRVRSG